MPGFGLCRFAIARGLTTTSIIVGSFLFSAFAFSLSTSPPHLISVSGKGLCRRGGRCFSKVSHKNETFYVICSWSVCLFVVLRACTAVAFQVIPSIHAACGTSEVGSVAQVVHAVEGREGRREVKVERGEVIPRVRVLPFSVSLSASSERT